MSFRQVAEPDIVKAVADADILVMVVPHQFVPGICAQIKGKIKLNAIAISLIKVRMKLYTFSIPRSSKPTIDVYRV